MWNFELFKDTKKSWLEAKKANATLAAQKRDSPGVVDAEKLWLDESESNKIGNENRQSQRKSSAKKLPSPIHSPHSWDSAWSGDHF